MLRLISVIERIVALTAFVLLLPAMICVAGIVRLLGGGSPLVAHQRLGRGGVPFWMVKFRTMWGGERVPASQGVFVEFLKEEHVPEIKTGRDPRVTSSFAAFCRRHSIDELPQLWHVIRGEMSLVGPRPVTPAEWAKYYGPSAIEVWRLRPGMSGLWQTRGRNRLNYRQRRRLDLFLARHYCLQIYLRIARATVVNVIAGRDAW